MALGSYVMSLEWGIAGNVLQWQARFSSAQLAGVTCSVEDVTVPAEPPYGAVTSASEAGGGGLRLTCVSVSTCSLRPHAQRLGMKL